MLCFGGLPLSDIYNFYYLPRFSVQSAFFRKNSILQILWERYSCYSFFLLLYVHSFHILFSLFTHTSTVFQSCLCFIYFMKFDLIIPDWMISTSFVTPIMFTKCTAWWLITLPLTYKYSINTMCQVCIYKDVIICMGKCRSVSCSVLQNHTAMYK